MAHVNVGFVDNRNSSRILKPPGGDTSDIFGTREPPKKEIKQIIIEETVNHKGGEEKTDAVKEVVEEGSIEEVNKDDEVVAAVEKKVDNLSIVEEGKSVEEVKVEEKILVEKKIEASQNNGAPVRPRNRVPPGGYSSGLW